MKMRKGIIRNVSNNKSANESATAKTGYEHKGVGAGEIEQAAVGYYFMSPDELGPNFELLNEFEVFGDVPAHSHPDAEEIWYVIEGEGYVQLGDEKNIAVKPRDMIYTPAGVKHAIKPKQNKTVRCLGIAVKNK